MLPVFTFDSNFCLNLILTKLNDSNSHIILKPGTLIEYLLINLYILKNINLDGRFDGIS